MVKPNYRRSLSIHRLEYRRKRNDTVIGFLTNIIGLTHQEIHDRYGNTSFCTPDPLSLFERARREREQKKIKREQNQNKLEKAKKEFNQIIHSPTNYLIKNRGKAKVNLYKGVFPLYSELNTKLEGTGCGVERHSIQKDKKIFKWTIAKKGLAVLKQKGEYNELYICESVIDALSLECLYQKSENNNNKRAYIATCGMLTREQRKHLKKNLRKEI